MTKQRMTKFEFEIQVDIEVSVEEYNIIEMAYNKSKLDLKAFCKRWAKINQSRILAYKKKRRLNYIANMFAKEVRSIGRIMSRYRNCPNAYATEVMDYEELDKLESIGISLTIRDKDGFIYGKSIKELEDEIIEIKDIIQAKKSAKKTA